ncbi:MAG: radical SAM protein [Elusimicrobiota bacterium]
MPNVFITNICNLRCKYCFAKAMLGHSDVQEMTLDEIIPIADLIKKSEKPNDKNKYVISILGGEPTLHSNFKGIIDYLIKDGFIIKLFTNGTFPAAIREYLKTLPSDAVNIILNINKRSSYKTAEWEYLTANLKELNGIVTLGFTIFEKNFNYGTIINYIKKYKLKTEVRLGISMPIVNADNKYVKYGECKAIAKRIVEFSRDAFAKDIILGFDCGFIICMFSRADLGKLQKNNVRINFLCDGAIDIGKNGRVWRCFPLHNIHNTSLSKFSSVLGIKDHYKSVLPKKEKGISGACGKCNYYGRNICSGGCYGFEFK